MGLYIICTSARTGGNLLCSTLADTGLLGQPGSFVYAYSANETLVSLSSNEFEQYLITVPNRLQQEQHQGYPPSTDLAWLYTTNLLQALSSPTDRLRYFYEHLKAPDMLEYLRRIRASHLGGQNWGIKILSNDSEGKGFDYFQGSIEQGQPLQDYRPALDILEEAFGEIKYIWLTRRNKVRQALSRWKAMHTSQWHKFKDQQQKSTLDTRLPTREELNKHISQLCIDDAYWEEFFTKNGITPLSLVYEDFVRNPEQVILRVLNYLEVKTAGTIHFPGFKQRKMASSNANGYINSYYQDYSLWKNGTNTAAKDTSTTDIGQAV